MKKELLLKSVYVIKPLTIAGGNSSEMITIKRKLDAKKIIIKTNFNFTTEEAV